MRSPGRAPTPSRSGRRFSRAHSRRPKDRSGARSSTYSRPATERRRWRRERRCRPLPASAHEGRRDERGASLDRPAARRLPRSGRRRADRRAGRGGAHRAQPARHRGGSRGIARARPTACGRQRSRDARRAGRSRGACSRRRRHDRAGGARSATACGRRNGGGAQARVRRRRMRSSRSGPARSTTCASTPRRRMASRMWCSPRPRR